MLTVMGDFTPGKYAARIIRMTVRDARALVDDAMEAGAERREGAGITKLDAWMRGHDHAGFIYGGLFHQSVDMAERHLRLCEELAESMALLLETAPVKAAPLVLERSMGEAVMRLAYMLDPEVMPARTVLRMTAYQLDTVEGNLRAAHSFGGYAEDERVKATESIATLQGWLRDAGFELLPSRTEPFTSSIGIEGQRENLKFNATDAYAKYVPTAPWMWELGSGVTHSRGWMLSGLISTLRDDAITSALDVALESAMSVITLADVLADVAESHTGVDADTFRKGNHQRRLAVTSMAERRSGLAVGHKEYAARGADWKPRPGYMGASFIRPPKTKESELQDSARCDPPR